MPNFPIYIYFLVASFAVSTLVFFTRRFPEVYLRYFSVFLLTTLSIEIFGNILDLQGKPNIHIYKYFTTFEFCFYLYIINLMIHNRKAKLAIRYTIVVYAIVALTYILFFVKPLEFSTVTYSLGCLLVVIGTIYYFLELFRKPKSLNLLHSPEFWICTALLFFYCTSFPLYSLVNYWSDISPLIIENFGGIISILNVFLYSLFSIAFLCRMTSRKYIL